jgi:hypothetical protein
MNNPATQEDIEKILQRIDEIINTWSELDVDKVPSQFKTEFDGLILQRDLFESTLSPDQIVNYKIEEPVL